MSKVNENKFPYKWNLKDGYPAKGITKNKCTVFGTFVCGGGSTMGYKLAGFSHLGGVELTSHYSDLYRANHRPLFFYEQDIRDFNKRNDIPKELYNIDLLDGSPPCASFSTVGAREKKWGKAKEYEGFNQKTDDLIFEYIKTVDKLKPKTFLMENVSGLIKGNAKTYVRQLFRDIEAIGYNAQLFSINAASLGVPQMRQRVFVIGHKKEYNLPKLNIGFNEPQISFESATKEFWGMGGESIERFAIFKQWKEINYPKENSHEKRFSLYRPFLNKPCNTLTESASINGAASVCHPLQPRKLNRQEASVLQSFPMDYNFLDQNPLSCIGRSVPPVMTAQISHQIWLQWLSKIQTKQS